MPDAPARAGSRWPLFLYNLVFPLAFLGMLPGLARRMVRRGNYRRKFGQRFARYDSATLHRLAGGSRVWVHSISVGETLVALKLLRKMRELDPELRAVLSVTTSTGFALAEGNAADWLEVIYNPIDALPFARRAIETIRPSGLIFMEAIWPNLLARAAGRNVPTALIARLSPRSEARFRRFRFFCGPVFRLLDVISVQDAEDVPRWQSLGADPGQIHVTGNMKFDHAPAGGAGREEEFRAVLSRLAVPEDAPILVGGSTFPGEEGMLARLCLRLRADFPRLFLILVPRHVERATEAAAEITEAGMTFALRTGGTPRSKAPDCLLVNTTGELRDWYPLATVVYIGKSMSPAATGGQNPVEPIFAGRPVTFGPQMENFRTVVSRLVETGGALVAATPQELEKTVRTLLREPLRRREMARRGLEIVAPHQGATERNARLFCRGA